MAMQPTAAFQMFGGAGFRAAGLPPMEAGVY